MQNSLISYLISAAERFPEKTAFCSEDESLTFSRLDVISRQVGTFLHGEGVYRRPVVVFVKKSPAEIAAFFGVIRGGCFYVPIDEEMPAARIGLILENVRSPLVICDGQTVSKARELDLRGGRAVTLGEITENGGTDDAALDKIYRSAIDTDPVYVVFTSGSTGVPKGVCACHRSVIDYIEQLSETLGFSSDTVFGNQSPLYFDACLKELIPTLRFGATTYLIPKRLFSTPVDLVKYLNENRINTICWVVSALTMISAFDTFSVVRPEYLRTVAFGSEVFPVKQFNKWRRALPEASFTNLYGPTETTGMCCFYRVEREFSEDESIPIGKPFPNREIILMRPDGTVAHEGEEGEICIRGTALTLGYYNDPERTDAAFVQNPLNTSYPEKIYKTGDVAKYGADGNLIFVSRKDHQIKHMGHRIELGEIEITAAAFPGVGLCACVYSAAKRRITLFFTGDADAAELGEWLRSRLPRYMIPGKTVKLDEMPLTPNGKIDRVGLSGTE